jgi:hypothetical protein
MVMIDAIIVLTKFLFRDLLLSSGGLLINVRDRKIISGKLYYLRKLTAAVKAVNGPFTNLITKLTYLHIIHDFIPKGVDN